MKARRHGNLSPASRQTPNIRASPTARAISLTIAVHHRSFVNGESLFEMPGILLRRPALLAVAAAMAITLMPRQRPRIFSQPWKNADRALVIDAYEYNSIDWAGLATDKRIVGFNRDQHDRLRRQRDRRL